MRNTNHIKDPSLVNKKCYQISKTIVNESFPGEIDFFDIVWETIQSLFTDWKKTPPEKWSFQVSQKKLLKGLGFADSARIPDLTTPILIAVLTAVFWHIASLKSEPGQKDIERMVENYSVKFGATGELKSILKKFLKSSDLTSLLRKEDVTPFVSKKEDVLKLEFREDKPYVEINGKEAREFRTKYKQFANLVALAAARKSGEGWLHRTLELDLGQSDQALSDIRHWIVPWLIHDVEPRDIVRAAEKKEKMIRLEVFEPKNINIDKSICEFRSKSEKRVKKLVKQADIRLTKWEMKIRDFLLDGDECKQLKRECTIMMNQMELIQEAAKKMGWKLSNQEWEHLSQRSEEVIKLCNP